MKKIKAFGVCPYKIINGDHVEILLCKSVQSKNKWGLLKGVQKKGETDIQTAIREFCEESSINVEEHQLENYFEQQNKYKDIGIWILNISTITHWKKFFTKNKIKKKYISIENSQIKFFNINDIPQIKNKQKVLVNYILLYLKFIIKY